MNDIETSQALEQLLSEGAIGLYSTKNTAIEMQDGSNPPDQATLDAALIRYDAAQVVEDADTADRAAKLTGIGNKVATLRGWADTAESTTVTNGNAVTVLQAVVDNLAVFYDGFADLLEGMRIDKE